MVLYVQELGERNLNGFADVPDTVYYNINKLSETLSESVADTLVNAGYSTYTLNAGRYVCIITMSLGTRQMMMLFTDFSKNKYTAETISRKFPDPAIIMEAFEINLETYDRDYGLVSLEIWTGNPDGKISP